MFKHRTLKSLEQLPHLLSVIMAWGSQGGAGECRQGIKKRQTVLLTLYTFLKFVIASRYYVYNWKISKSEKEERKPPQEMKVYSTLIYHAFLCPGPGSQKHLITRNRVRIGLALSGKTCAYVFLQSTASPEYLWGPRHQWLPWRSLWRLNEIIYWRH